LQQLLDGITKGGNLLKEPNLSCCSIFARALIMQESTATKSYKVAGSDLGQRVWTQASAATVEIFTSLSAEEQFKDDDLNPFKLLSTYFRTVLQYATLMFINREEPFKVRLRAIESVVVRLADPEIVDLSKLPASTRHWIQLFTLHAHMNYGPEGNGPGKLVMVRD
jgi:hypothetical protein